MSLPKRLGITLPIPPDVDATMARALWAEQRGIDAIWFADAGGADSLTLAAAIAMKTERIRLGMGIVPVYTRTPALFASTVMTLSHLAPGRIIMGLGSSSHAMIEGWHGIPFEKPLTRVKEATQMLRKMLTGERETYQGRTLRSSGFRLAPPAKGEVPIYLAALRPNMLEMAAEVGDGVVLNSFPVEALPRMMEHMRIGAGRGGKNLEQMEIVNRHHVAVTDDVAAGREQFRAYFTGYFATPVYNKFLAWFGYEEAAHSLREGWREKDRARTAAAMSDELIDRIAVIGNADRCRDLVREYLSEGITTPVINPISNDPAQIAATFEAFTPENFPL
ncbi:MAG: LLM class flavin-dependent oxidoreductase [SAR324 cluster bacterium]|nr:LLM class flavin-dependent oxidoreductase [SAR324 cluster bacterium]